MWSVKLFYAFLKLLRCVFHAVGFLRLSFNGTKQRFDQPATSFCKDYMPGVIIFLIICVHFYLILEMEYIYSEIREMDMDALPEFDILDLLSELTHDAFYALLLIICLLNRNQLFQTVDQAQLCYKELRSQLKKRFDFRCSSRLFLLGISQLLLLILGCLKLFCLDFPLLDLFGICDYIMSAVRLLFVLVLSLQFFYHLLHATLLQSINLVLQQPAKLKLLHKLLNVQPLLHKLQLCAATYFGPAFCCFYALLCLRCGMFVSAFSYDERRFAPQQRLEVEMDPFNVTGMPPMPPTRNELLRTESMFLAWQAALMWLLLCAAHVQQREQHKLFTSIWNLAARSESGQSTHKDCLSLLTNSKIPPVDFRPGSLNFLACDTNSPHSTIKLVGIARSLKLLLHLVVSYTVVYYVQQQQQQSDHNVDSD